MEPIRVVWGTGSGPTALAAYDAALAAANVHEYNLVPLSSVIPAGAAVEEVGTAPDLGPVGDRLSVVEAAATAREGPASAALAWARGPDGNGIFYEAAGQEPSDPVVDRVESGLDAGVRLREWPDADRRTRVITADGDDLGGDHVAAVVLAVYGSGESLL